MQIHSIGNSFLKLARPAAFAAVAALAGGCPSQCHKVQLEGIARLDSFESLSLHITKVDFKGDCRPTESALKRYETGKYRQLYLSPEYMRTLDQLNTFNYPDAYNGYNRVVTLGVDFTNPDAETVFQVEAR